MIKVSSNLAVLVVVLLLMSVAVSGVTWLSSLTLGSATALSVFIVARIGRISKRAIPFLGIIALLTVLAALAGTLPVTTDDLRTFFFGEGRLFVGYAAFTAVAMIPSASLANGQSAYSKYLRLICLAGLILLALWLLAKPPALGHEGTQDFHGLTSSHHASGFLFSFLAIGLFASWTWTKRRLDLILAGAASIAVFFTGSRTSLLGLIFVSVVITYMHRRSLRVLVAIILLATLGLSFSPRLRSSITELADPDFVAVVFEGPEAHARRSLTTGQANALVRVAHGRAFRTHFLAAPLTGIGFLRYNDVAVAAASPTIAPLGLNAAEEPIDRSEAGAHNLLLHLLVEIGIAGTLVFLLLWIVGIRMILSRLTYCRSRTKRAAAYAPFAFIIGAAFGGNSVLVPAILMPLAATCVPISAIIRYRGRD